MMEDDDSISVDTTSAVSEHPEPRNNSGMKPLKALGNGTPPMKEEKVEFDAAPVYRQMEKRKCQEVDCPNNGSRCKTHGKLRLTCKVKGCQYFVQAQGFCNEHGNLCPIKDASLEGEKEGDLTSTKKRKKSTTDDSSKKKRKMSVDKSAPSKPPPPRGPTNEDVILSMLDKKYKSHMHEHYRNMEKTKEKVSVVGQKILEEFKAQLQSCPGAALLKKSGKIYVEASEEEALRKIKADLQGRHQTTSWRFSSNELKLYYSDDSDETLASSSKSQKESQVDDNLSTSPSSSSRCTRNSTETAISTPFAVTGSTCHDNPLSYVGNYVAELLKKEGWSVKTKKVDSINFGQVICSPSSTGVEGVDKFTGYEAIAKWAYKTGYYKERIVEADDDKAMCVLRKANILDDPYSIFKDVQGEPQEGEDSNPVPAAAAQVPSQRREASNAVMEQPPPAAGAALDSAAPVQIRDEDVDSPNKISMVAFASSRDNQDYWRMFEQFGTSLAKGTAENDQDSIDFYHYLLSYLESKAGRLDFSIGSDKDIIDNKLASFELAKGKYERAVKENMPGKMSYKFWLTKTINDCKAELPLV